MPATAGHKYLIEQAASPFTNLPYAQVTGAPATTAKHLGPVTIGTGGGAVEGPFGGTPAAVPGTVQAENYDTGGAEVAYRRVVGERERDGVPAGWG